VPRNGVTLPAALHAFLECGLMLDAWMGGLAEESFSFAGQELLARTASALAAEHWREPSIGETLGTLPAAPGLGRRVAMEVLSCSAAAVAHERVGRIVVDTDTALEVARRLRSFVDRLGFGPLVRIFLAVTGAQSLAAVDHYGEMLEEDFISGALHRPWSSWPLDDDLRRGLALGQYTLHPHGGRRYVRETATGRRALADTRAVLQAAGYLAARLDLTWVSHFNVRADLDGDVARLVPDAHAQRLAFTRFCRVLPGMSVVDVGCGQGMQLLDGGICAAAGPGGAAIGVDPAAGMLARARRTAALRGARNVTFVRGRAESLPFNGARFDLAMAIGVLEYTDAARAVAEMRRVVRRGGAVAVIGACQGTFRLPAVQEWFRPMVELAEHYGIDPEERSTAYSHLGGLLDAAGLVGIETAAMTSRVILAEPSVAVRMIVEGSDFGLEILERIPWAAREELIAELLARGRAFCAGASLEQRTLAVHTDFARGAVP
jgi:ubiquinone/menaquinone biosynthesis C-methylase UbiE